MNNHLDSVLACVVRAICLSVHVVCLSIFRNGSTIYRRPFHFIALHEQEEVANAPRGVSLHNVLQKITQSNPHIRRVVGHVHPNLLYLLRGVDPAAQSQAVVPLRNFGCLLCLLAVYLHHEWLSIPVVDEEEGEHNLQAAVGRQLGDLDFSGVF